MLHSLQMIYHCKHVNTVTKNAKLTHRLLSAITGHIYDHYHAVNDGINDNATTKRFQHYITGKTYSNVGYTLQINNIYIHIQQKNVPCMVSRPSNCHRATLRTLWNMQDSVHISHNNKPGTQVFLRHCGLGYTS